MKNEEFKELKGMISLMAVNMITKDDIKDMATKADFESVKADLASVKADMEELRASVKADMEELRASVKADMEELRASMKADIEELRFVTSQELQFVHDTLKRSIEVLTDQVVILGCRVDGSHDLVLDKKEYINHLPKMEDRLFALETVCKRHTCQIENLMSAGV